MLANVKSRDMQFLKRKYRGNIRHSNYHTTADNLRLLFAAFVIGTLAGIVGSLFRLILSFLEDKRLSLFAYVHNSSKVIYWILAIIAVMVSVSIALFFVKKYAPEASGSGVQEIEGALDEIRPMRWKRVLPVKFFASLFSLGAGLLLGREGPTIQLGANVGKMIKDIFKLPDRENNPLISAGAGAGLAAAFNAPFAGIIFVIEELHEHFRFNFYSVASIMIGSAMSDLMVRLLISPKPVIDMTIYSSPNLGALWLFFVLGLFFSLIGYAYNKSLIFTLDLLQDKWKLGIISMAALIGSLIAITGIISPDLIGGGYALISEVLKNSFSVQYLLLLFIIRFILSILSYSSGVPGGIFAPLLTIGIIFGMLFGVISQNYFPDIVPNIGVFAIAGMAAIFSSTVIAPLTGLVLAVEMTANYEMILPLIITTFTASVGTRILGNKPIYATLLERTLEREEKMNRTTHKKLKNRENN